MIRRLQYLQCDFEIRSQQTFNVVTILIILQYTSNIYRIVFNSVTVITLCYVSLDSTVKIAQATVK